MTAKYFVSSLSYWNLNQVNGTRGQQRQGWSKGFRTRRSSVSSLWSLPSVLNTMWVHLRVNFLPVSQLIFLSVPWEYPVPSSASPFFHRPQPSKPSRVVASSTQTELNFKDIGAVACHRCYSVNKVLIPQPTPLFVGFSSCSWIVLTRR